jgi:hypothetical protein
MGLFSFFLYLDLARITAPIMREYVNSEMRRDGSGS